jgi:hypothetical protein
MVARLAAEARGRSCKPEPDAVEALWKEYPPRMTTFNGKYSFRISSEEIAEGIRFLSVEKQ